MGFKYRKWTTEIIEYYKKRFTKIDNDDKEEQRIYDKNKLKDLISLNGKLILPSEIK